MLAYFGKPSSVLAAAHFDNPVAASRPVTVWLHLPQLTDMEIKRRGALAVEGAVADVRGTVADNRGAVADASLCNATSDVIVPPVIIPLHVCVRTAPRVCVRSAPRVAALLAASRPGCSLPQLTSVV